MGRYTNIGWTDSTWNPVMGCLPVSPGCKNCYAAEIAARFKWGADDGVPFAHMTIRGPQWTGRAALMKKRLEEPLRWQTGRKVFVCSMSDLFYEKHCYDRIAEVFSIMMMARRQARKHTYQILTKRAARMRDFLRRYWAAPAPHIWCGVTAENEDTFYERVDQLMQTPATLRFVSMEPLLEQVDITHFLPEPGLKTRTGPDFKVAPALDWVIVGGESGKNARPMNPDWVRKIRDDCKVAGVPFFFKGWGSEAAGMGLDGQVHNAFPQARREAECHESSRLHSRT